LRIRFKPLSSSILIVSILAGLVYILGWSSFITIQSVVIKGTNQTSLITAQLVAGDSKLVINEPLARINPKHEENLITDLEWVKSAKVSRNWWSREVSVLVEPRIPVAIFKFEGETSAKPRYLSSDGRDFSSPQNFSNLATISLVRSGGEWAVQRKMVAAFVSSLSIDLITELKNLEITKKGEIIMATELRKPVLKINWGESNSAEEIAVKSNVLKGLLALPENKKITFVDLTVTNAPIVK
jgi:cell division septal protein FtsQ